VSGNSFEQIARKRRNGQFGSPGAELIVEPVDQLDELLVLIIDGSMPTLYSSFHCNSMGLSPRRSVKLGRGVASRSRAIWMNFSRLRGRRLALGQAKGSFLSAYVL
jgi:hypothetical protein